MLKYVFISADTELKLNFILRENIQSPVYNNYKYLCVLEISWSMDDFPFFKRLYAKIKWMQIMLG